MAKKLSTFLAVIAVVAFAAPAVASAAPEITVNGGRAPVGTPISGKSTSTVWKTELGNFACSSVSFSGEVTANTGSTVAAKGTGPMATSSCTFKGTTPFTIEDATLSSLHSATPGAGTVSLTYSASISGLTCHYSNSALPFTYAASGNTLTIKGNMTANPTSCGDTPIESTFTITSAAGSVLFH